MLRYPDAEKVVEHETEVDLSQWNRPDKCNGCLISYRTKSLGG
jgi:hypothetical protein